MRADLRPWTVRGMGLAFGILLIIGLVILLAAAAPVLLQLFIAVLLASALAPMVGTIRERTHLGRGATILIVYATFFLLMLVLAFIVLPAAVRQGEDIVESLPPFFAAAREWASELRPAALGRSVSTLIASVAGILRPPPPPDTDTVVEVGTAVAEATVWLATLLVLVFFWMVEHARLQRYVLAFVPVGTRAGARDAWNEIESRLGMWVRGQLILMSTIGVATGILYTVLGLPGALLLALIAALTEAIPIVGPLLGAIPAVLVAATVSPELAVVVAVVYLVLQLVEGSVLVPMVMRNTVGISPLLVLLSLLIGGTVGGIVGAFLAVPIAASVEIVLARLQARETPVAQDPASAGAVDKEALDEMARSLPDAANAVPSAAEGR